LVITQEWIAEALTMWFITAVIVLVTTLGGSQRSVIGWVYRASAVMLLAVAGLTTLTGARTLVTFSKICPVLSG